MERDEGRRVVERFWAAMAADDFRAAGDLLDDGYALVWPQSGERVRGRDNFLAVSEHYPAAGPWRFVVHRLIADGGSVATEVSVTDGIQTGRAITFSEVRDGRMVRQTEYWPDPIAAAQWRAAWVERADG